MEVIERLLDRVSSEAPYSLMSQPGFSDQLVGLKAAGDDFEKAYGFYRGLMRIAIDQTPIPEFEALNDLGRAMDYWRRSMRRKSR